MGDGRLRAEWTFTDAGEPGSRDMARIAIRDAGGTVVLEVSGNIQKGESPGVPRAVQVAELIDPPTRKGPAR